MHQAPKPFPPTPFFATRDSHTCSVVRCFASVLFIRFIRFKPIVQFSIRSIHFLLNLLQAVRTLSCILEGMSTLFEYFKQSGLAAENSKVLPKPDGPLASLVPSYNFHEPKISQMITSAKFIFVKSLQLRDSRNFLSTKISSYTVPLHTCVCVFVWHECIFSMYVYSTYLQMFFHVSIFILTYVHA